MEKDYSKMTVEELLAHTNKVIRLLTQEVVIELDQIEKKRKESQEYNDKISKK